MARNWEILDAKSARLFSEETLRSVPDSNNIRFVMEEIKKATTKAGVFSVSLYGVYLNTHELGYLESLGYHVKYECEDRPCGACFTKISW